MMFVWLPFLLTKPEHFSVMSVILECARLFLGVSLWKLQEIMEQRETPRMRGTLQKSGAHD